jgi:histone chaperone ASF1
MSIVNVTNVLVHNNPCKFTEPFKFEISFECIPPGLQEELEWKMIYVGSAEDEKHDQELECVLVGPVSLGQNKFTFEAAAPDPNKIPKSDLVGVTVLLVTCSYKDKEFVRIGYYLHNDYSDDPELKENPPAKPDLDKLKRHLLADKPRVTRFQIPWDANETPYTMSDDDKQKAAAAVTSEQQQMQQATANSNNNMMMNEGQSGTSVNMNGSSNHNAQQSSSSSSKSSNSSKMDVGA